MGYWKSRQAVSDREGVQMAQEGARRTRDMALFVVDQRRSGRTP